MWAAINCPRRLAARSSLCAWSRPIRTGLFTDGWRAVFFPDNGWFAFVGLEKLTVGKWLDLAETLSRALGTEIETSGVTGSDDLDAVLTELETFLDIPEYAENAPRAFWSLSYARGRDRQLVLRTHIAALIMRDDRAHILAGLNLVTHQSGVDVDDYRSRFVQLARSKDPAISNSAQSALRHIDE